MSSLVSHKVFALATGVSISSDELIVALADGRTIAVPLEWFPKLANASEEQRLQWRLIGSGIGIHWELIDEDISVAGLLAA